MTLRLVPIVVVAACGARPVAPPRAAAAPAPSPGSEDRFGPLEVGADYRSYRKLTDHPFLSLDHGNLWVDVYVNAIGADAYLRGDDVPVGTTIIKTSWPDDHGRPAAVTGPLYVMQKRAPGYDPAHGDWYYAIWWPDPPPEAAPKFTGPSYWRGKSPKIAFCAHCHDSFDHSLGGLTPSSALPR